MPAAASLGSGTINMSGGGELLVTGGTTFSSGQTITLGAGGGVISATGLSAAVFPNAILGGTGLTATGTQDIVLNSGSNSNIGTLTVNSTQRLFDFTTGTLANGAVVNVQNGIFDFGLGSAYAPTNTMTFAAGTGVATRGSTVTLSTANVTFPSAGTISFNNDDQATSALTVNGAWPTLTGNLTIQIGGSHSSGAAVGAVSLTGAISGGFGITMTTGGNINGNTLLLSGANTYSGPTTVTAGTLEFVNETSLYNDTPASWTAANIIVDSGATLALAVGGSGQFTAADVQAISALGTAGGGFLSGSTLALDTGSAAGGSFTYGNSLANPNGGANMLTLKKIGTGTLVLTAANTYTGGTTVVTGTLAASNLASPANSVLEFGTGKITLNNGTTLQVLANGSGSNQTITTGNGTTGNAVAMSTTVNGNATLNVNQVTGNSGNTIAFGALSNPANNNVSALTVTGGNGYGVSFTSLSLSGSTGNTTELIPTGATVTIAGAVTNPMSGFAAGNFDTLQLDGTSTGNSVQGAISDSATFTSLAAGGYTQVTKSNSSTWTLSGTNTYHGPTTVSGGTLRFAGSGSLPSATAITLGAATLAILNNGSGSNGTISLGNSVTLAGSGTLNVANNGSNTGNTVALGALSNPTTNANSLTLSAANGYLVSFTSLALNNGTGGSTELIPSTSSVVIAGNVTNPMTTVTSGHFDTLILDGTTSANAIQGAISDAAGGSFSSGGGYTQVTKQNTSTWVLSGTNTYTGPTAITGGALNIQNNGALGNTSGVTVASGAALQLQGGITTGATSLTLSGTGLAASPNGALENVSGANTFAGPITLAAAATIGSDAGTLNLTNSITGSSTGLALTLTGAGSGSLSGVWNGGVTGTPGAGTLTKTGAGAWTISAVQTYTGVTTVAAGTLNLNYSGGSNVIASGNALSLSGGQVTFTNLGSANTQTFGTTTLIIGASQLTQGSGYTAGVLVNLGTLSGTGAVDVSNLTSSPSWIQASGNVSQSLLLGGAVTANGGQSLVQTDASGNLEIVATTDYLNNAIVKTSPGVNIRIISTGTAPNGTTSSGFVGLGTSGTTDWATLVNAYTSGTTTIDITNTGPINSNILRLGASGAIASSAGANLVLGASVANGGTLTAGGAANTAGTLTIDASNTTTVNAVIADNGSGSVALTTTGSGTVILANNNTYSGTTTIGGGTLRVGTGGATGSLGTASSITDNGTLLFNTNTSPTIAATIGGSGGVTQAGSGTLTLSANNTFTGPTTITAGIVAAAALNNAGSAQPLGEGSLALNGGEFKFTAAGNSGSPGGGYTIPISIGPSGGTFFNDAGGNGFLSLDGPITGTGTLTILSNPTAVLSNNSQIFFQFPSIGFSGNVLIGSAGGAPGVVQLRNSGVDLLGTGTVTINSQGLLSADNGGPQGGPTSFANNLILNGGYLGTQGAAMTYSGNVTLNPGSTSTIGDFSNGTASVAMSGVISGSGNLTIGLSGNTNTVTLSNVNTYTGTTNVAFGTLSLTGTLGAGAGGGTAITSAATFTESAAGLIAGTSSVNVTGGTTTLAGANTYTGGTTVGGGTLAIGVNSQFAGSGASTTITNGATGTGLVTVNSGKLDSQSFSPLVGGLAGSGGTIASSTSSTVTLTDVPSGTQTYAGTIANTFGSGTSTLAFTLAGSGTQILTGANTYSGATTINSGTLRAGASNTLSQSSAVTVAGGTLDVSSFANKVAALTITSGVLNLGITNNTANTLTSIGPVALGGTINVSVSGPSLTGSSYVLISGSAVSGSFTSGTLPAGYALAIVGGTALDLQQIPFPIAYWGGAQGDGVWSTLSSGHTNWLNGPVGADAGTVPTPTTDVVETANTASNLSSQSLGTISAINSLTFTGTGTANAAPSGGVTLTAGGTLTINAAASQAGGAGYAAGGIGIVVGPGSGANTINANVALGASQTWSVDSGAATLTIGGAVSGGGSAALTLGGSVSATSASPGSNGNGTIRLSGNNTFSGGATIASGTVLIGVSNGTGFGALGPSTASVTLGSGSASASLLTGGAYTFANAVNVAGSGTMTIGGNTDNNSTFSGPISLNNNLTISQVANAGSNALSLTGGISNTGSNGGFTITFAGPGNINVATTGISDTDFGTAAVKVTGGSTTFSVANTYSGNTSITAGTLKATNTTGSAVGTGNVLVSGTGALAGSASTGQGFIGTSGSPVTVTIQSGGTIVGTTQAMLTVNNALTLQSGALASFSTLSSSDDNNGAAALIKVTGNFMAPSSASTVTVAVPSGLSSGTYDLISFGTAVGGFTNSTFAFNGGAPSGYSFVVTSSQLDLSVASATNSPMNAVNYWSASPPNQVQFGTANNWHVQTNNGYVGIQSNIPGTIMAANSPTSGGKFLLTDQGTSANPTQGNPLYAAILAGTNSGTYTGGMASVNMSWRARALQETDPQDGGQPAAPPLQYVGSYLISNVLYLTGLGGSGAMKTYTSSSNTNYFGTAAVVENQTDPFVLQMNYNVPLLSNEGGQAKKGTIYLGWLEPADPTANGFSGPTWEKAVTGDFGSGNASDVAQNYQGSFLSFVNGVVTAEQNNNSNPFFHATAFTSGTLGSLTQAELSDILGSYGVDPSSGAHDVWAVINHNSQFAVVPEPSTLLLAALGLAGLAGYRVRRRRFMDVSGEIRSAKSRSGSERTG